MPDAQERMESMLRRVLESCSFEELRDYVSALNEVQRVLVRAHEQGSLSQKEADMALSKWLTE